MSSTNSPIQVLSDALTTLEQRVSNLESPNILTRQLKKSLAASIQQPIQMLQERIKKLVNRIYGLERGTSANSTNDSTDDSTSTIQCLHGIISELVGRVDAIKDALSIDPSDPTEPISSTEIESSEFKFSFKKSTDSSNALIQISASNPLKPYYLLKIEYPVNGETVTNTTAWSKCPSELTTAWTADQEIDYGAVSVGIYLNDNSDGSGTMLCNKLSFSSRHNWSFTLSDDDWTETDENPTPTTDDPTEPTEDPDDDEPTETKTKSASLVYTKSASDISNSTLAIITPKPPASYFRCTIQYTQNNTAEEYTSDWMECPSGINRKTLKSFSPDDGELTGNIVVSIEMNDNSDGSGDTTYSCKRSFKCSASTISIIYTDDWSA